jgi:mRNA-degrading endonuclease toxin of MazEF toxin-antitoxin module
MSKTRPVLIIQPNRLTELMPDTFVVVPLSSDFRTRPIERLGIALLRIHARDKLEKSSVFLIEQIRTVSPLRFKTPGFLTQLKASELWVVQIGIQNLL